MKKVSVIFDYIYYRVAKAYSKIDYSHGSTGIASVLWCQSLLILDFGLLLVYTLCNKAYIGLAFNYLRIFYFFLVVFLTIHNYKMYKGKYWILNAKWSQETKKQKILHGILVILAILLPIIVPMAIFSF